MQDRSDPEETARGADEEIIRTERLSALGQMASGIAHDFNNQLSMVLGYSELLLMDEGVLDNRAVTVEYLDLIKTAAQDAAEIVRRLRSFYRYRDSDEAFTRVALNDVVEQAVSLTRPRWGEQVRAGGRTIEVGTVLAEDAMVSGNEVELREVLTNLIFNAVDAIDENGTITVATAVAHDTVSLSVSDNGSGMDEETLRRCMEPFYTTKGEDGTGLGLGLVHGIVRRHEGTIDIDSKKGRGTTVSVALPALKPDEAARAEGSAEEAVAGRALRLLVVDDEPRFCKLIHGFLVSDGHRVEIAHDGREGLQKFLSGHFDVVILDQAMPRMSGTQVAAAIKRMVPDKPVVLLTGFRDAMEGAGEHPGGVDVLIGKPITLKQLRATLAAVMQKRENA